MKHLHSRVLLAILTCFTIVIGCASDVNSLKISPSKLEFGKVSLGSIKDIEVTITNNLGESITVNKISISGSNTFSITSGNTTSVAMSADSTHKFTVSFEPQTAGKFDGKLVIDHTNSDSAKEVSITGEGANVPEMTLSETSYDFNKRLINKTHNHVVTVTNSGTANLSVSSLTFSGSDASKFSISSGNAPFNVTPGSTHDFTISFTPIALQTYSVSLKISHNGSIKANPFEFAVQGEGTDVDRQITLSEQGTWDFGSVATTMSTQLYLEIANTGSEPVSIISTYLHNKVDFDIVSVRDSSYGIVSFPHNLTSGKKIYVWVKFDPTAKTNYSDTLTIAHNASNMTSPTDVSLIGSGRDEIVKKYSYTGASQQFQVPSNISEVRIEAYGAEGGHGYPYTVGSYDGGLGGKVEANFTVTPNITMLIYVGGRGVDGTATSISNGGWNGGGKGYAVSGIYAGGGGSGGGASDVRVGGTDLSKRIIVAGAGAGSGYGNGGNESGGAGGGLTGEAGYAMGTHYTLSVGSGGTQSNGGAAAATGGTPGSLGLGGDGGSSYASGGGGAGYYGGGGGNSAGGGGGSSFTNPGASKVSHQQGVHTGNGEIEIYY